MNKIEIFTMDDWKKQVLSEEKPVLVDFQAPWCTSLLIQYDSLMQLAYEVRDEAKVYRMDITLSPIVAMAYRLIDFPTLSLFHNGQLLKSFLGIGRVREMKHLLTPCLDAYVGKLASLR